MLYELLVFSQSSGANCHNQYGLFAEKSIMTIVYKGKFRKSLFSAHNFSCIKVFLISNQAVVDLQKNYSLS